MVKQLIFNILTVYIVVIVPQCSDNPGLSLNKVVCKNKEIYLKSDQCIQKVVYLFNSLAAHNPVCLKICIKVYSYTTCADHPTASWPISSGPYCRRIETHLCVYRQEIQNLCNGFHHWTSNFYLVYIHNYRTLGKVLRGTTIEFNY